MSFNKDRLKEPVRAAVEPSSILTPSAAEAFMSHAVGAFPGECVGYIHAGTYHPWENTAPDPEMAARIPAEAVAALVRKGEIDAIAHSHPNGPDCPSMPDMKAQMEYDIPFALVSTDGNGCLAPFVWGDTVTRPPLLGRQFRHGVTDCYGLIRDFHKQILGNDLADCPRDWEWWLDSYPHADAGDLYEQHFREWNFKEVDSLEFGDSLLFKIGRTSKVNHASVYIGGGLMLHHLTGRFENDTGRVSKIEPIARWGKYHVKTIRYGG